MNKPSSEFIATAASISDGMVELQLIDGSRHAFPVHYYPALCGADLSQLQQVQLRVGGRALRWDCLDEDIWIADAILQKYPPANQLSVADAPPA